MAVAPPSFGGVVIRHIFPVIWMTWYLYISWGCSTSPPGWGSEVHTSHAALGLARENKYPIASSGRSGLLLAVRPTRPQVEAPGTESAVYDWLVDNALILWLRVAGCTQRRQGHRQQSVDQRGREVGRHVHLDPARSVRVVVLDRHLVVSVRRPALLAQVRLVVVQRLPARPQPQPRRLRPVQLRRQRRVEPHR